MEKQMRKKAFREFKREGSTMLHTGFGVDRRADKLESIAKGFPQWFRRYQKRYGL